MVGVQPQIHLDIPNINSNITVLILLLRNSHRQKLEAIAYIPIQCQCQRQKVPLMTIHKPAKRLNDGPLNRAVQVVLVSQEEGLWRRKMSRRLTHTDPDAETDAYIFI